MKEKIKVLSIDDEPHIGNLLKLSLDKEVFEVYTKYSAMECLKFIKNNFIPDVFVIDLMMPGINGYELLMELKENKETKNIPKIVLSHKGQMNDKLHAIDCGSDDYITKPFDPDDVARKIRLHCRR